MSHLFLYKKKSDSTKNFQEKCELQKTEGKQESRGLNFIFFYPGLVVRLWICHCLSGFSLDRLGLKVFGIGFYLVSACFFYLVFYLVFALCLAERDL